MTLADTYRDVAHLAMLDLVRQPREVVYAADPYIAALEAERQQEHTKRADLIVDLHRMTERAEQAEAELATLTEAARKRHNDWVAKVAALEAEALQQTECAHKALKQCDRAEKKLDSMKIMERHADWKLRAEAAAARVAELERELGDEKRARVEFGERMVEAEAAMAQQWSDYDAREEAGDDVNA